MDNELISRPCVTDLTFQVYDRAVHPEFIETRLMKSFERDGSKLALHLTPAGHVLAWRYGTLSLVEILGDQSRPFPELGQLFSHRVGGERSECHSPKECVSYQTCFQLERLPEEVFFHAHDELRRDGENNGVLHQLRPQCRLGLSPISFVDLQARPGSILVHVYHTYPDEFAIVKSQSLIEFRPEEAKKGH
ncbi:MAG: DUF2617 family protein [Planctomycetota bacterium]